MIDVILLLTDLKTFFQQATCCENSMATHNNANFAKVGHFAHDGTCEWMFEDVGVPVECLLGWVAYVKINSRAS